LTPTKGIPTQSQFTFSPRSGLFESEELNFTTLASFPDDPFCDSLPLATLAKPLQHISNALPTQTTEEIPYRQASDIAEHVDLYYPAVQAHHAPRQKNVRCKSPTCTLQAASFYTCHDCFFMDIYCQQCMIARHQDNPFHVIKMWDRHCLKDASLMDLGLELTLPHTDGASCNGSVSRYKMTVYHTTGIHKLALKLCRCSLKKGDYAGFRAQLAASRLFPATHKRPTTAFTYDLLETFDALNLEGALNVKQFLDAIVSRSPTTLQCKDEVSCSGSPC
jgi:hypothetical protein